MDVVVYFLLCLTALAAGAMNAIAGGGTLLTFPALLEAPVSSVAANVTSTIALLPGSIAGSWGYRKELHACRRWILWLTVPSLLGDTVGALALTHMDDKQFRKLIPWLILTAAVLFLIQPIISRLVRRERPTGPPARHTLALVVFVQFLIGIYGGFFGAGIGILMLTSLAFLDLGSIHEMNALKSWLALCMNGISAILFIIDGQIVWPYGLAMAVAAIVGGNIGTRLALRLKPVYVRWIVIAIGFGLAGHFFLKQESGVRNQESGVRGQGSGVRSQESGVRNQGSGVRGQESGVRDPADVRT
jgi:uncharacterized membrane protein YfcA